jgi:hypothetical protein
MRRIGNIKFVTSERAIVPIRKALQRPGTTNYFCIKRREREKGALPGALRAAAIAAVQERAASRRVSARQDRNISVGH